MLVYAGTADRKSDNHTKYFMDRIGESCNLIKLDINKINNNSVYVPKHIHKKTEYLITNFYWMRYVYMPKQLPNYNLVDLYLITSNKYDRYPLRKYLSFFSDSYIIHKYGRSGHLFCSKKYNSCLELFNTITGIVLYRFGYLQINTFVDPIILSYWIIQLNTITSVFTRKLYQTFTLSDLISSPSLVSSPIVILRCYYEFLSNGYSVPHLKNLVHSTNAYDVYLQLRHCPTVLENDPSDCIIITPVLESFETFYPFCLICKHHRSPDDFCLCGHGICWICQSLSGSLQCHFCNQHFFFSNFNLHFHDYIQNCKYLHFNYSSIIQSITDLKVARKCSFDF